MGMGKNERISSVSAKAFAPILAIYGLIATSLIAASPSQAADLAYGKYLAGECVACHSVNAEAAIPPINALPEPYFIEALKEYQDGERDHELMQSVARSLGEAEIEALAAYFAELEDQR